MSSCLHDLVIMMVVVYGVGVAQRGSTATMLHGGSQYEPKVNYHDYNKNHCAPSPVI